MEEDEAGETGAIRAAVRSAKKASRPAKIGEPERRQQPSKKDKRKKAKAGPAAKSAAKSKGAFDKEMGQRPAREGVRAKKGDVIGGMGKKKGGKRKS